MSKTLAIVWLVTLSHIMVLGILQAETKEVKHNIETFITKSNR